MSKLEQFQGILESINFYYDSIKWKLSDTDTITSNAVLSSKSTLIKQALVAAINQKIAVLLTIDDIFTADVPAVDDQFVCLNLKPEFIQRLDSINLEQLHHNSTQLTPYKSYFEKSLKQVDSEVEQVVFAVDSLTNASETNQFIDPEVNLESIVSNGTYASAMLNFLVFGITTFNTLRKKELTLDRLATTVFDNGSSAIGGSIELAYILSSTAIQTTIPFFQIARTLTAINNERIYRKQHREQLGKYLQAKDWIPAECNRIVAEFNTIKTSLIRVFQAKMAQLELSDPQKTLYLTLFETQLQLFATRYQQEINQVKQATGVEATKLQVKESKRRINRLKDIADIGIAVSSGFFPPMALGFVVTGLFDIGMRASGNPYITNTARANHGLSTNSIVKIDANGDMTSAINQMRQIKNISIAILPKVVTASISKIDKTIASLKDCTNFALKLPQPYQSLSDEIDLREITRAIEKIQRNIEYLTAFTDKLAKKYHGTIEPKILNLQLLQDQLKQHIDIIIKKIDNYGVDHTDPDPKVIKLAAIRQTLLNLSQDKIFNYQQSFKAPDKIYLKNCGLEIIADIDKFFKIMGHMSFDQSIVNHAGIINEFMQRINNFNEIYTTLHDQMTQSEIEEFDAIKQQIAKISRLKQMLHFMQQRDENTASQLSHSTLKHEIHRIEDQTVVNSAPGVTVPLKDPQIAIVPERRAFGWSKKREISQQVAATLQAILANGKTEVQLVVMPYATFKAEDVRDARDAKILRDKVEGLKNELQWLNALQTQLKAHPHIKFANLDALSLYYKSQMHQIKNALFSITTFKVAPKGTSKFRQWLSTLGTIFTNLLRIRSAKAELSKFQHEYNKFFKTSLFKHLAKNTVNSQDDIALTHKAHYHPTVFLDTITEAPMSYSQKEAQRVFDKLGLDSLNSKIQQIPHKYQTSETEAMALLVKDGPELEHVRHTLAVTTQQPHLHAIVNDEAPITTTTIAAAPIPDDIKIVEDGEGKTDNDGEGEGSVEPLPQLH